MESKILTCAIWYIGTTGQHRVARFVFDECCTNVLDSVLAVGKKPWKNTPATSKLKDTNYIDSQAQCPTKS